MEAGGIDCTGNPIYLVKTPHIARLATRDGTYSDSKVHRRTQSDKEFEATTHISTQKPLAMDSRLMPLCFNPNPTTI